MGLVGEQRSCQLPNQCSSLEEPTKVIFGKNKRHPKRLAPFHHSTLGTRLAESLEQLVGQPVVIRQLLNPPVREVTPTLGRTLSPSASQLPTIPLLEPQAQVNI